MEKVSDTAKQDREWIDLAKAIFAEHPSNLHVDKEKVFISFKDLAKCLEVQGLVKSLLRLHEENLRWAKKISECWDIHDGDGEAICAFCGSPSVSYDPKYTPGHKKYCIVPSAIAFIEETGEKKP